jgi:tripartite-type tricarboxylate transporter receptor subunit TctC
VRRLQTLSVVLATIVLPLRIAGAQNTAEYPVKPVRVIVPSAPGGGIDIPARMFAQLLSDRFKRPFVVDNRAGGGGVIAHELVAKSVPDGYTLLAAAPIFTIASALNPNLPYDPIRDFTPISLVTKGPYLLLVNPAFPARSVTELIAFAKARPGALNIGVSTGGGSHLAAALFASMAGIRVALIPYKGSGPVTIDTISGQLHMFFGNVGSNAPHIKSGRLRALAVSGAERSSVLPDLPAIAESIPGFDVTFWHGWLAPARTPAALVGKLNAELARAVRSPEVARKLAEDGGEPVGSTPDKFRELIAVEIPRWRKVVKEAGIRAE